MISGGFVCLLAQDNLSLLKVMPGDQRVKDGVQIYLDEIVKILKILTGHRIDRSIGIGHGIEERFQGTLYKLDKGFLEGILARSS